MTIALIDIGSNTIRLSTYEIDDADGFHRLFGEKVNAGLAAYVDEEDSLTPEGIECACRALRELQDVIESLGIEEVHAFATASLRNVGNGIAARDEISSRTGLAIELVSAEDEALMGYSSFRHDCDVQQGVLVDIGGGSTEVTCFDENEPVAIASLPLGSLKLYKRRSSDIMPTTHDRKLMRKDVARALDDAGFQHPKTYSVLCGIGGTARSTRRMINLLHGRAPEGKNVSFLELKELVKMFQSDESGTRDLILRMCPDRIHTFIPGVTILHEAAVRFGAEELVISDFGIREGYLCKRVIECS